MCRGAGERRLGEHRAVDASEAASGGRIAFARAPVSLVRAGRSGQSGICAASRTGALWGQLRHTSWRRWKLAERTAAFVGEQQKARLARQRHTHCMTDGCLSARTLAIGGARAGACAWARHRRVSKHALVLNTRCLPKWVECASASPQTFALHHHLEHRVCNPRPCNCQRASSLQMSCQVQRRLELRLGGPRTAHLQR